MTFLILGRIGGFHVEPPYVEVGQIFTILYFVYYLVLMPLISLLENTLFDLNS